ncbi:MAG TPA: very short patch repair endonuclease [Candidatus Deferrimicrobium sp.]|nr:very short patch repair endonuclease [Candidatus Deferrimicrobium sp.]
MVDIFSKEKRFQIMQANKRRRNKSTELKLIEIFKENGIKGWRRQFRLFGSPDFVFPKERTVIFTDGCFWHGHDCRNTKPSSNKEYWDKKIKNNKNHDLKVNRTLEEKKWKVIRLWECELKKGDLPQKLLFLSRKKKLQKE